MTGSAGGTNTDEASASLPASPTPVPPNRSRLLRSDAEADSGASDGAEGAEEEAGTGSDIVLFADGFCCCCCYFAEKKRQVMVGS